MQSTCSENECIKTSQVMNMHSTCTCPEKVNEYVKFLSWENNRLWIFIFSISLKHHSLYTFIRHVGVCVGGGGLISCLLEVFLQRQISTHAFREGLTQDCITGFLINLWQTLVHLLWSFCSPSKMYWIIAVLQWYLQDTDK